MADIVISSSWTEKGKFYVDAFEDLFKEKCSSYRLVQLQGDCDYSDSDAYKSTLNKKAIAMDYAIFILTYKKSNNGKIYYGSIGIEIEWAIERIGTEKCFVVIPYDVVPEKSAQKLRPFQYVDNNCILSTSDVIEKRALSNLVMAHPASNILFTILNKEDFGTNGEQRNRSSNTSNTKGGAIVMSAKNVFNTNGGPLTYIESNNGTASNNVSFEKDYQHLLSEMELVSAAPELANHKNETSQAIDALKNKKKDEFLKAITPIAKVIYETAIKLSASVLANLIKLYVNGQ